MSPKIKYATLITVILVLAFHLSYRYVSSYKNLKIAQGFGIVNASQNEINSTKIASQESTNGVRKLIIILTGARSGSTWLGTIFQQIDDLFYVFEPLDPRFYVNSGTMKERDQLEILSNLCTCTFKGLQSFGKAARRGPELSSKTKYNLKSEMKGGMRHMEEFCRQFNIVMPKCIRLRNPMILQKLQDYGCHDFQVVHLIRDPRSIIKSRMATFHELYSGNGSKQKKMTPKVISEAAKILCNTTVFVDMVSQQPWLQSKYFRIRYEDLVLNTSSAVEDLFHFINKPVTKSLTSYIEKTMSGNSTSSGYSVIKDSKKLLNKWQYLKIDTIRLIETACEEFMRTFNYEVYEAAN